MMRYDIQLPYDSLECRNLLSSGYVLVGVSDGVAYIKRPQT